MFRFAAAAACRNPAEAVYIRNLRPVDLGIGTAAPADTVQPAADIACRKTGRSEPHILLLFEHRKGNRPP